MFYGINFKELPDGSVEVSCPDIPECVFVSDNKATASEELAHLVPGCLHIFYRKKGEPFPLPKSTDCDGYVHIPVKVQAKMLFWNFLKENSITLREVAKRLDCADMQAQRLVDITKDNASIDAVERAFMAFGQTMNLTLGTK